MNDTYITSRLQLDKLQPSDVVFILELLNTPEWIKFIGERNVKNSNEAEQYINKIIINPSISYWIVRLKNDLTPLGVVTFIKKEYLEYHDIGFAFLRRYTGAGYAFEAAGVVLQDAFLSGYSTVLATSVKGNSNSIRLLQKLGFHFEKKIERANDMLLLYKKMKSI